MDLDTSFSIKSEVEICQYLCDEVLVDYKKIFDEKFPAVGYLVNLLGRQLNSKISGQETKSTVDIISGVVKFFDVGASDLTESQKKHALSLFIYVRAIVQKKMGKFDDSIKDLASAMALNFDSHYLRQRASIYMLQKKYDLAFQDFRQVNMKVEQTKDKFHAVFFMSECLFHLHKYTPAVELLDEYIGILMKNTKEWENPLHSIEISYHWRYFSKFILQRAEGYLRMNKFEKVSPDYEFVAKNFVSYFGKTDKIGHITFCVDLEEKFGRYPNFREFFFEYLMTKDKSGENLVSTLSPFFSEEEVEQKKKELESGQKQKKSSKSGQSNPNSMKSGDDDDPFNVTKQLVLIKNGMPESVMKESRAFPERILYVLSQVFLEDLTWTSPTLKYWSCNILDFSDRLIPSLPLLLSKSKKKKTTGSTKNTKGPQIHYSQRHFQFFDPGRRTSILPLDYYRYVTIGRKSFIREVFLLDPLNDRKLLTFLNRVHNYETKSAEEEMKYLVHNVLESMGGTVDQMTQKCSKEIEGLKKNRYRSFSPDLLLNFVVQSHMDRFVQLKQRLVVTFGDLVENRIEGVCRHRAVLFKLCCDVRNIPCRLVRGYITIRGDKGTKKKLSHAWNIVRVKQRLHIVDLMNGDQLLIPWTHENADMYRQTGGSTDNTSTVITMSRTLQSGLRMGKALWKKSGRFSECEKKKKPIPKAQKKDDSNPQDQKKEKESYFVQKVLHLQSIRKYFETHKQNDNFPIHQKEEEEEGEGENDDDDDDGFVSPELRFKDYVESKRMLMRYLRHPNLVHCQTGSSKDPSLIDHELHTFSKHYQLNGREFHEYLRRSSSKMEKKMRIMEVLIFLISVCKGLRFLHRSGIVHGNLKLDNVMVNLNPFGLIREVKICDFYVSGFQQFILMCQKREELLSGKFRASFGHMPMLQILGDPKNSNSSLLNSRSKYFSEVSIDVFSFGMLAKQFEDNLPPRVIEMCCRAALSESPKTRPSLSSLLRCLEGSLLREFHRLGGTTHRERQIANLQSQIEKFRLDVKEGQIKLEDQKVKMIQFSNEAMKEREKLVSQNEQVQNENKKLKNETQVYVNEEVEKRLEKETESYLGAVKMFRERMSHQIDVLKKQCQTKDKEIEELKSTLRALETGF